MFVHCLGAEIYNTYGDLSNGELLRKYGFVDEENPFDCVEIPLEIVLRVCQQHSSSPLTFHQRLNFLRVVDLLSLSESTPIFIHSVYV
jgi:hypothetical protein